MSAKQTIAQTQFASIHGRSQANSETQVARLLRDTQAKLEGVTLDTTHPLLRD